MRKTLFQIAVALILVMTSSCPAFASFCFTEAYGVGVRSMAMGQAFTAVADDYAALYFNPAGLAQTTETTISINLIQPVHDLKVSFLDTGEDMKMYDARSLVRNDPVHGADGDDLDILFPVLGLSANINRLVSRYLDIPINIQAGMVIGFPENFNSLFTTNTTAPDMPNPISFGDQIEHFMATLGFGLEIKKDLVYLGWAATVGIEMKGPHPLYCQNVWLGYSEESRNVLTQAECPAYSKLGNQWGILFTPFDKKLKLGISYREQLSIVTVDFTPIRVYLTPAGIPQDNLTVMQEVIVGYLPEQISFGLAYTFDRLTLSADYKYQKWGDYKYTENIHELFVINEQGLAQPGRVAEPGSPDFDDVAHISVGMSYERSKKLTLMAGYEFRPTQVPDQSYRISNYIDMDKDIFSVGLSYQYKSWMKFGVLCQYMMLADYKVYKQGNEIGYSWGGVTDEDKMRSYKIEGDAMVFGLSVEFAL